MPKIDAFNRLFECSGVQCSGGIGRLEETLIAFPSFCPLEFLGDQRKAIKKFTLSVLRVSAVNYCYFRSLIRISFFLSSISKDSKSVASIMGITCSRVYAAIG